MAMRTQDSDTKLPPMSYRQIADDLAARIATGEYQPGARMPKYSEIAALYSVSYATAARAYGLLQDRGLTVGSPGRAVYVAEKPAD